MKTLTRIFVIAALSAVGLSARAQMLTEDVAAIKQLITQVQQGMQQVEAARRQVEAMTDVPREIIARYNSLLNSAISNPLQNIENNLNVLRSGAGTGSCTGSSGILGTSQYAQMVPMLGTRMDFIGAEINGAAARTSGLLACTQQMMRTTQQRLQQLPDMATALQACNDVTCVQGVAARIQLEHTIVSSQTQQAILVNMAAQQQRWTAEQQIEQKQAADAQAQINATGGASAFSGSGSPTTTTTPARSAPMFSANNGG